MTAERSEGPIRVGISACLLGETVRFDGGHKRDAFLTDTFGRFVQWVPVCPEVEAGLGTPREAMRLVRDGDSVRLVTVRTREDHTSRLTAAADRIVARLESEELSGYVLKKDSPSCGLSRVKVYDRNDVPARAGRGLFATALLERLPHLPVEEEGRLSDPRIRDNFVERVFAFSRLRRLFQKGWRRDALVRFHTAHKLILMAHSPEAYRSLGRLVAGAHVLPRGELHRTYTAELMTALAVLATRGRHANVLQHMAGYLKERLERDSKAELQAAIGTTGTSSCPSSCRSRCCGTTCACTRSSISRDSSISTPIRRS
jgi:uncharacterized protein YbbK (DUF523 family)/uncharacterized protein YbgA (DUF1722 family)